MKSSLRRFVSDRSGATAIEYSLICTLIAVIIFAAVGLVGTAVQSRFTTTASAVSTAVAQ